MALAVVLIALFRYFNEPAAWKLAVAGVECLAIVAAGLWLRIAYYPTIGIIGCALLVFGVARDSDIKIHPAWLILLAGLGFFALGLLVTFSKKQIVAWAESFEAAMVPAAASASTNATTADLASDRIKIPVRFRTETEPPEMKEMPQEKEPPREDTEPRRDTGATEESREPSLHQEAEEPKPETERATPEVSDGQEEPAAIRMEEGPQEAEPPPDRSPFAVAAFQDLGPDVLDRIRRTARLADDEIPLTVIGRSAAFDDWSVVVTLERIIVRVPS
jgi:hypothetical protein